MSGSRVGLYREMRDMMATDTPVLATETRWVNQMRKYYGMVVMEFASG